jgi:hypothetical protein
MSLFGFMSRPRPEAEEPPAARVPSPGIDSEDFEAEYAAEDKAEEALKAEEVPKETEDAPQETEDAPQNEIEDAPQHETEERETETPQTETEERETETPQKTEEVHEAVERETESDEITRGIARPRPSPASTRVTPVAKRSAIGDGSDGFELPPAGPRVPLRKTLQEFIRMSFWEILDIPTGTQDARVIKKAFLKMSLIYHPDKGGEDMTFAFIGMVQEVLSDPYKRFQYEHGGHQAFTEPFAAGASENSEPKESEKADAPTSSDDEVW